MTKIVVCEDCGHEGDGQEFTYFTDEETEVSKVTAGSQKAHFLFTLQCPKCYSRN